MAGVLHKAVLIQETLNRYKLLLDDVEVKGLLSVDARVAMNEVTELTVVILV